MAKGGKYLRKKSRKGRGWKIVLGIFLVLALLIGSAAFVGMRYYRSLLGKINRAEVIEQSVSFEDIQAILDYNPDKPTGEDLTVDQTSENPAQTAAVESTQDTVLSQETAG